MGLSDQAKAYAMTKASRPSLRSALEQAYRAGWWASVKAQQEQVDGERNSEVLAAINEGFESGREHVTALAEKAQAVYQEFCESAPHCAHGDHMRPFADLIKEDAEHGDGE